MYALAAELRQQGIVTAVLSNQYRPILAVVRHLKHLDSFDPVVISCEVGTAKPKPLIYQLMLERLQLSPDKCIFIDNRRRNVWAAKALGLHTILARSAPQTIHDVLQLVRPTD